jgi:hypothetical protein
MKTFDTVCAQGDVLIRRVDAIPNTATAVAPDGDRIIITHSETGHDHVMMLDRPRGKTKAPSVEMYQGDNPLVAWIKVNRPTALEHLRPHDTHEPILFGEGCYEIRRQREHTPEGWRQVSD